MRIHAILATGVKRQGWMTGHILFDVTLQLHRQVSQEHNHRGAA
jgi:hypothetical protein